MKMMSGHEIKQVWLDFFAERDHAVAEGASLVPINDPTLLWINAGVAALKGYFDGSKIPENPRIVNAQKCIRTNDIENVGKTARHHTFFEMLGNFSIGDYFRDDAIEWGYALLTDPRYFGFDPNKLYFTVYPTDQDTKKKWLSLGVPAERIIESESNFWEIGQGPCGPCTEIFYDRGSSFGPDDIALIAEDIENDRYIEIWNIVFSQFNAKPGLTREEYPELPNKNIDTGMGLERMACIIQQTETNFETDLFFPVIKHISRIAGTPYDGSMSFKVIADHMRTVTFAVSDGATLSNEGRGYVLRRLLRRAIKHGRTLGIDRPFLKELVDTVVTMMEDSYPYLSKTKTFVKQVIEKEEVKFLETLHQGEKMLESLLKGDSDTLSGQDAFMLYDTYGFPLELTEEYAEQHGKKVDRRGFNTEMQAQKDRARSARKVIRSMKDQNEAFIRFKTPSTFVGYDTLTTQSPIIAVFDVGIVVEETPFYAESGGQVSDHGLIVHNGNAFEVIDVEKLPNGQFLHVLENGHGLKVGQTVELRVDQDARTATRAHHSVTHLLYQTLRELLGDHVSQQGSLVGPDYMRFDFNHFELPSEETILAIEQSVNEKIMTKTPVHVELTTVDQAKTRGAIAEFGEKYESTVRMIDMGGTLDLCGGTHVDNTADIERFAIAHIESKGSGIYRITGLAKNKVHTIGTFMKGLDDNLEQLHNKANQIIEAADKQGITLDFDAPKQAPVRGSYRDMINRRRDVEALSQAVKKLERDFHDAKERATLKNLEDYLNQAINGTIVLKTAYEDANMVKGLADRLMEHLGDGVVFIANVSGGKLFFVAKSKTDVHAGNLVKEAAAKAGGSGGGRPDFAQAGARNVDEVDAVIDYVKQVLS
ncbi:MAG: alanine--tRNA ligase [Acholeplasmatales bacterium]|nr:MAG: alanine--tRNA ligase [Acholeplasmatales bacterium]